MLKDLLKVANKLDALGLTKEADVVDSLIRKMAVLNRQSAPSISSSSISEIVSNRMRDVENKIKTLDFSMSQSYRRTLNNLKEFITQATDKVYVTSDGYNYQLWLEDPLDPRSKADPRKENGMSIIMSQDEMAESLGEDHLRRIKSHAKEAGSLLESVKKSGYGEWMFSGDLSQLEESGYTSDVLK